MKELAITFRLDSQFIEKYKSVAPPFGFNGLGLVVYNRTYSRQKPDGSYEQWYETCERVINGMYSIQRNFAKKNDRPWSDEKAMISAEEAYDRLFNLKWSPPGRGLWMMGSEFVHERGTVEGLQNCFSGDTKIITKKDGPVELSAIHNCDVDVWTRSGWKPANIKSFGEQVIYDITFAPATSADTGWIKKSRSNVRVTHKATRNHRWILSSGSETTDLRVGDAVPAKTVTAEGDRDNFLLGFLHGLVFGDGNKITHRYANGDYGFELRACSDRVKVACNSVSSLFDDVNTERPSADGDPIYKIRNASDLKELPPHQSGAEYIAGFIDGWCKCDASYPDNGSVKLTTTHPGAYEWFIENAAWGGYIVSGVVYYTKDTNYGARNRPLALITLRKEENSHWVVESINELGLSTVFCPTVPDEHSFLLASGIYTGNCAYTSTAKIAEERGMVFRWFMEMLMLGVGVGGDMSGAGLVDIKEPDAKNHRVIVIDDSREGWADSVKDLIDSYLDGTGWIVFDYSDIRPRGSKIVGFGGIASGPEPLMKLHKGIVKTLDANVGKPITTRSIADVFNMIGACVVAGNVRRSAEILLGNADDEEFMSLKDYSWNGSEYVGPSLDRAEFGWTSNNTVFAHQGMDYSEIAKGIHRNGEPGIAWMDNVQDYGRMNGILDNADGDAIGFNPCQPGFATVLTPDGIKTFDDIDVGSTIWTGKKWTKVSAKWHTGNKPVFKFVSSFGEFVGTENHNVIQNGQRVEAIDADHFDAKAGPTTSEAPNPEAIIDGLMIGDGSVHKDSNTSFLIIGEGDQEYYDSEISSFLVKDRSVGFASSQNFQAYTVNSSISLDELPLTYERRVPDRYLYSESKGDVTGFLRGLFTANGSVVANGGRVTLKQTSHDLIKDVQKMLSSIGIRSYVTINKPSEIEWPNGTYTSRQSYDLNITQDRVEFANTIGFIQSRKNDKIAKNVKKGDSSGILQEVEYVADMDVYDITVEDEEHVYWTGGVIVSNCAEQPLHHKESCTLVELFPTRHADTYDFMRSIKFAYLYGKTVTLASEYMSDNTSREVMMKNRRIGLSITGITQYIGQHGMGSLKKLLTEAYNETQRYDEKYSMWLGVNKSIRTTSVKPSGTISLLAGVTPGVHFPHSRFYIRRMRIANESPMIPALKFAGYHIESCVVSPETTSIVSFPVDSGKGTISKFDVGIWEQLEIAATMQEYWSDNAVSCTISFDPEKTSTSEIERALGMYESRLKSISMLPNVEGGAYAQMPYESIDEKAYNEMVAGIKEIATLSIGKSDKQEDKYCDGEACTITFK